MVLPGANFHGQIHHLADFGGVGSAQEDAALEVAGDQVARAARDAADDVSGGLDVDAPELIGHRNQTARIRADVIALQRIGRRCG